MTGPDTTLDGVFRVQALRTAPASAAPDGGSAAILDRHCRPFGTRLELEGEAGTDEAGSDPATLRMMREFGVTGTDLAGAPQAGEAWAELCEFIGTGPLVVPDVEAFTAWFRHLNVHPQDPGRTVRALPRLVGLADLAALLFPGRLASRREKLVDELVSPGKRANPAAIGPRELHEATSELVRRFLALEPEVVHLAAAGYAHAWRLLGASDPEAAARLGLALGMVERPDDWCVTTGPELPFARDLPVGALSGSAGTEKRDGDEVRLADLVTDLEPRCARDAMTLAGITPLPPDLEDATPFTAEDHRILDDVFSVHLPALFPPTDGKPSYREGQHLVAREVARAFDGDELVLAHAPTGTGKTLGYLVPALLWAMRHGVRVGIATYTRALQEQAMDLEVPRALAALARTSLLDGNDGSESVAPRVCLLKGRENYLCWRALKLHLPSEDDEPEEWLSWTSLALFAATDPDGDLDRFPRRPPLELASSRGYRRRVSALARHVRSQTSCCTHQDDRRTCAAEVARRRAERSHLVVTNHSFALFRQEFFRRLVFDECEHLHDQAHNAWSFAVTTREIRGLMDRLYQPGERDTRAPINRIEKMIVHSTPGADTFDELRESWRDVDACLSQLERSLQDFENWRAQTARAREDRDAHSLLREYFELEDSAELLHTRRAFTGAGNRLDAALAEMSERLDQLAGRGKPRLRRALDLQRADLQEVLATVEAWIPVHEEAPRFRPETFHDVAKTNRGECELAARVLLPNEYLGRNYYPTLATGVFLSATTFLRGGFEASLGYLGLDRVANPAEDEERVPRPVRTFRAPEVFDYERVLVCVPRDAPPLPRQKQAFLDYVRRFVQHLGERTRGRMLVLFTNAEDARGVGRELEAFFRARRIPLWYQNMEGARKEELGELFRSRVDSVLLGVDTFWYGADFPGETLEYLVLVRLPYGVPDRYHHAQCATLGTSEQRRRIYLPRALAKFRQGFGRLMRRESDKGCVFLLDGRVLDPRHRIFMGELPIQSGEKPGDRSAGGPARVVRGDTDRCIHEALAHMGMLADLRRRGLDQSFGVDGSTVRPPLPESPLPEPGEGKRPPDLRVRETPPPVIDVAPEDIPF